MAIDEKDPSIPYFYAGCDWRDLFANTKFRALSERLNLPLKTDP